MHCLEREVILKADAKTVWEFLATPLNLNQLTPPELEFEILSAVPERMYDGLTILYRVRIPRVGRQRWLTEIKHIDEGNCFVDEQRLGPYRLWYHYHQVEPLDDGRTRVVDRVTYKLPFGILGKLVHEFWVKRLLKEIFDFRSEKLRELFG